LLLEIDMTDLAADRLFPGLASAPNFRDLAASLPAGSEILAPGRIYRSEALVDLGREAASVVAMNIRLVCDLRSAGERDRVPNAWWREQGIEILDLDVLADIRGRSDVWQHLRDKPGRAGGIDAMHEVYRQLPAATAPHLDTIFSRIEDGQFPMLIHCTAGKDRTGFACAMILFAIGASYDDVVADYLATNGRIGAPVAQATRQLALEHLGVDASEDAVEALIQVERTYLDAALAAIRDNHGSVDDYLRNAVGLDEDRRARVASRLSASPAGPR
jgi:protein-tyrosine phosphatase